MFPISVNYSIKHSIPWLWSLLSSSLFLTAFYMWRRFLPPCRLVCISHGFGICFRSYYFPKYKHPFFFPYAVTTDSKPRCRPCGVWFSAVVYPWLMPHSSAEGAEWTSCSLVSFVWRQFAYGFPTICLVCTSFAVYLCTKSSGDPLWDLFVKVYLDEGEMA